jgi:hypothetical protein
MHSNAQKADGTGLQRASSPATRSDKTRRRDKKKATDFEPKQD